MRCINVLFFIFHLLMKVKNCYLQTWQLAKFPKKMRKLSVPWASPKYRRDSTTLFPLIRFMTETSSLTCYNSIIYIFQKTNKKLTHYKMTERGVKRCSKGTQLRNCWKTHIKRKHIYVVDKSFTKNMLWNLFKLYFCF